ncbi:MAG: outer membrane lipoprotein carrier protein LolA [Syntrophobacterales bacterium]|jgi:outer membrane lipoprotein carrier protein
MKIPTACCLLPFAQSALRFALYVFIAFLAQSVQAHGQETTSELVAKVQHQYDQTRSLHADFRQETRSRAASLGTIAKGRLYFLKPRAIRWDYSEPRQQFVINDEKAWLYVPDEKTIYLYEVDQIINSPIVLSFFSGLGQLTETFDISQLPPEPGPPKRFRLELLPRETESPVARVMLWIDAESYRVVRIQTEDPLGNINEITFTNVQVNAHLEPSWFALNVPQGVRLERQEAMPSK